MDRRGFKKKPEIKHKPYAKKGDVLVHKHSKRLAVVRLVFQDWDTWLYEVGESRYSEDGSKIDFGDIDIMTEQEISHWNVFDPKDIENYRKEQAE